MKQKKKYFDKGSKGGFVSAYAKNQKNVSSINQDNPFVVIKEFLSQNPR